MKTTVYNQKVMGSVLFLALTITQTSWPSASLCHQLPVVHKCPFICTIFLFSDLLWIKKDRQSKRILLLNMFSASVSILFHSYDSYSCWFTGDYCDVEHCHNGGTCVTGVGDDPFICICADGFGGDTCNLTETGTIERTLLQLWRFAEFNSWMKPLLPSGPCIPNPCKNDGLCEVTSPTRRGDVFNEYICNCQTGFEGAHCQISRLRLVVINESKLVILALAPVQQHNYSLLNMN